MVRILLLWALLSLPAAMVMCRGSGLAAGRRRPAAAGDTFFDVTLAVLYAVASLCILTAVW